MISFLSNDSLAQNPEIADKILACGAQPEVATPHPLSSVRAALRRARLIVPPLHVIITDDNGVLLGRASLAPVRDHNLPFAPSKSWRCLEFFIFQGAEAKISYGIYAACTAAMRELGFERLLNLEGQNLLPTNILQGGARLYCKNMCRSEGDADSFSPLTKKEAYRRLLDLAEISAVEMELYICNSDMFGYNQNTDGSIAPHP